MLVGSMMMPEPIMFTATRVVSPMRFIFLLESAIDDSIPDRDLLGIDHSAGGTETDSPWHGRLLPVETAGGYSAPGNAWRPPGAAGRSWNRPWPLSGALDVILRDDFQNHYFVRYRRRGD
ncbi:hypothetical protein D3C81_1958280 [compost metagenome]